ncbi:hypothetical protein [Pseudoduganella buxea]|uniref:Uncharacterized protein n=1 Tax=Pseudoduganella buxea TaxID=1949069 RepID=A0A6I3T1L4_9BURK|nr:hypothetical protein [Pseudoduganella buxea]MTV55244.1 hypothetical protein [Pseudoduganella buxea]GGB94922.1 hypothetical protein GCM10011572_16100 [Pseudoduganella buxea]
MKNLLSALVLIALAVSQGASNASGVSNVTAAAGASKDSSAPDVSKYAAQQGWTLVKSNTPKLPVSDITPVLYTAKGDAAPSCGLLAHTAAGTEFFELMSPEKGAGFPQCLLINDAAAFEVRSRQYLVVEYIARDTVEDFYRQYFYLYRDPAGRYIPDSELNDAVVWTEPVLASRDGIDVPRAQEGVRRARGTLLSKTVPGMRFLGREFMAGKNSSFAVFQDRANSKCVFLVDVGAKPATYGHELFAKGDKCESVLASGKMERAGTTYYLALFKGVVRNHLGIVSVGPNNVVAAETGLAIAVGKKSKLADLKSAKEALKLSL